MLHPILSLLLLLLYLRLGQSTLLRDTGTWGRCCELGAELPARNLNAHRLPFLRQRPYPGLFLRLHSGHFPLYPSPRLVSLCLRHCTCLSQVASPQGTFSHRKLRLLHIDISVGVQDITGKQEKQDTKTEMGSG